MGNLPGTRDAPAIVSLRAYLGWWEVPDLFGTAAA
jgi:uncharacterized membrane protein